MAPKRAAEKAPGVGGGAGKPTNAGGRAGQEA